MLIQFQDYLSYENIYFWSNFSILPFWILLIFAPNSTITQIFVNSIIIPLILASSYIYVVYQIILLEEPFSNIFELYFGLDGLYTIFATESFLLIFWLHYLALNIFLGSWIACDAVKYNIRRSIVFFPLVLVYFMGPVGMVLYWIIRIFYSKKIKLHD